MVEINPVHFEFLGDANKFSDRLESIQFIYIYVGVRSEKNREMNSD